MPSPTPSFVAALRGDAGALDPENRGNSHRARLVAAMVEAVAEHGYPTATVAEVVRRAQVSRRTFYVHFADRDDCLLATYDACSDLLIARIAQAVGAAEASWDARVAAGVDAYLRTLAEDPGLARVFILDVLALGPEALSRRRAVHRRYAQLVLDLAAEHRDELSGAEALDPDMVAAMVGALNEIVLNALADGDAATLADAAASAQRLVRAMLVAALPETERT